MSEAKMRAICLKDKEHQRLPATPKLREGMEQVLAQSLQKEHSPADTQTSNSSLQNLRE